jgi:hypothetical protein
VAADLKVAALLKVAAGFQPAVPRRWGGLLVQVKNLHPRVGVAVAAGIESGRRFSTCGASALGGLLVQVNNLHPRFGIAVA